jgi:hypothetical protein
MQKTGRIKMDGKGLSSWKTVVVCVLMSPAAPLFADGLITNYDNNPNLQKAMEYDLTLNSKIFFRPDGSTDKELYRSYVAKASREMAEKYYLAYLEEVKEPFQRLRVYAKLSNLYSGGVRQEVAPHPTPKDIQKALEYCRKALAEVPEAVGFATIHIRGVATMLPDPEERFCALEDYYQWMLSLDEQEVTDHWLPLTPGEDKPDKATVDYFLKIVSTFDDTTAYNLVDLAVNLGRGKMRRPSPDKKHLPEYDPCYLREIIQRFPGTRAEEYANREMAKLKRIIAGEQVELFSPMGRRPESAPPRMERPPVPLPPPEKMEEATPVPLASTAGASTDRESSFAPYLAVGVILAVAIVALVAVKGLQGRKKPEAP